MNDDSYLPGFETEHAALARLVGAFVDGELPPALDGRVGAHLEGCEECRGAARIQIAVRARLGTVAPRGLSSGFRDRILAGLDSVTSRPQNEAAPRAEAAPAPSHSGRRRFGLVAAGSGWLVAAGLAGFILVRADRAPRNLTMMMGPVLPVPVDSTPTPMAEEAIRDFSRVTGEDLPAGISLDSLQTALKFAVPALRAPHMRLVAVWRTVIDQEPAGALAYICHNRLVVQYVVSDEAFFRLARIRQAVAASGLYATGQAGVHTVGWPAPGSGSFLVGEFSAAELAAMRL